MPEPTGGRALVVVVVVPRVVVATLVLLEVGWVVVPAVVVGRVVVVGALLPGMHWLYHSFYPPVQGQSCSKTGVCGGTGAEKRMKGHQVLLTLVTTQLLPLAQQVGPEYPLPPHWALFELSARRVTTTQAPVY